MLISGTRKTLTLEFKMKYYLKKRFLVPMVLWNDDEESYLQLIELGAKPHILVNSDGSLDIVTLEGRMKCPIGDYVAKGASGEFYAIRADIREKTYDEVDPAEVISG